MKRHWGDRRMQPGEMPIKVWAANEAKRDGVSYHAVFMRLRRHGYPEVIRRYVNKRIVFVRIVK